MPYTKVHKLNTRRKILHSAAQQFRTNGMKEVSVQTLMKNAGLTHGGFYAHFKNKDHLITEVISHVIDETLQRLQDVAKAGDDDAFQNVIHFYLNEDHRDHSDEGCIIPVFSNEISRAPAEIREIFTKEIERFISFLASLGSVSRERALGILSTMIGAMLLSRSVSDPVLSRQLLDSSKKQILEAIGRT